jgi:uncharacterized membrane protein
MRALLFIVIVLVVAVIAGVATGFVDINQIRGAKAPEVSATQNGVTAKGGQAPAFDVETGSVKVGSGEANVTVPKVTLEKEQKRVQLPKVEIRRPDQQANQSAH